MIFVAEMSLIRHRENSHLVSTANQNSAAMSDTYKSDSETGWFSGYIHSTSLPMIALERFDLEAQNRGHHRSRSELDS